MGGDPPTSGMAAQQWLTDPIVAGLASAYFLASFLFAGYVLRVYIEVRREFRDLTLRVDKFKYLERQLDHSLEERTAAVLQEGPEDVE